MQIGEVSERTGMSLRTLRHYDEVGLLRPSHRSEGGFRLYTEADLDRALLIRRMRPLGYSLEEMHDVVRVVDALDAVGADVARDGELDARLGAVVADASARREELRRHLRMADELLELLEGLA